MRRFRVVGSGRAGRSFSLALSDAGWTPLLPLGRDDYLAGAAATGVDVLLLTVPDAVVAKVAAEVTPNSSTVVMHCAGALGLDVLAPHPRVASVHPLVSLPDGETGAERLVGATFAVAGDPMAHEIVEVLRGRAFEVSDADRTSYHATAAVASNHLVALLGQVERMAERTGVPFEAFLELARGSLDNVAASSPAAALTGPVARGDWETVAAHFDAIPADERDAYLAGAALAARLAGRHLPDVPVAPRSAPTESTTHIAAERGIGSR